MAAAKSSSKRKEYEETPDWGTLFQRRDNEPPRPQFTGDGVLDADTLEKIAADGGKFQMAVWTRSADGKAMKNRDGSYRFRVHIEPVYNAAADDDADDDDDDDDLPF